MVLLIASFLFIIGCENQENTNLDKDYIEVDAAQFLFLVTQDALFRITEGKDSLNCYNIIDLTPEKLYYRNAKNYTGSIYKKFGEWQLEMSDGIYFITSSLDEDTKIITSNKTAKTCNERY